MKILYLHQYFTTPDMVGGTRSYELARRLVQWGHEVHVITTDRSQRTGYKETQAAGVRVHWLPVEYSNEMSYARRTRAFLRFAIGAAHKTVSLGGDVVFASSTPLTIALPAAYAKRRLAIPMVFEVRDLWPAVPIAMGALDNPLLRQSARWLENFAYRHADHLVALSVDMKAAMVHSGVSPDRITVIENGCDFDLFDIDREKARPLRERLPWLGARPLVVYIGTLGLVNGVDYLARIAAASAQINPDVRFLTIGSGRQAAEVRSVAAELDVLGKNFFMMDAVPKQDVPLWMAASDVATSLVIDKPELAANSANKFFDALAAGRPIAINHGGWQAELLLASGAGVVLPPANAAKAAVALVDFLRDTARLKSAAEAAKRLGRERFDRDMLASRLRNVLENVRHQRRPGR